MSTIIRQLNAAVTAAKSELNRAQLPLLYAQNARLRALGSAEVHHTEIELKRAEKYAAARRADVDAAYASVDAALILLHN